MKRKILKELLDEAIEKRSDLFKKLKGASEQKEYIEIDIESIALGIDEIDERIIALRQIKVI